MCRKFYIALLVLHSRMGIVLLSINGIGLGHTTRMTIIADQLYAAGQKPIMFYQGKKFPFNNKAFHTVNTRNLFKADAAYLRAMESKVNAACNICGPRIFIEDTHPASIRLRNNIARFLLIRPTTFGYLQKITALYEQEYDAFFIADHADSPTWPYNDAETAAVLSWPKCYQVGPVFRRSSAEEIAALKIKYRWSERVPIYVFSMGGGGQQAGANDVDVFLQEAQSIIHRLGSGVRFLFVKGPLFPTGIHLPPQMEVIDTEQHMPALFAIAKAAVIRPSFNSIWECIQAQTPFYYIQGATFSEPIDQKMKRLATFGLADNDSAFTESYREQYQQACNKVMQQWNGFPNPQFYSVMEQAHALKQESAPPLVANETGTNSAINKLQRLALTCKSRKIFLRVDDVVSLTPELHFILSLAKELGFFCSLEVIPYLSTLEQQELLPYGRLVVSQHGYGHVLNTENPPGIKSEFSFCNEPPAPEVENLLAGKQCLERQFPLYFKQGFSAPFDCFPPWLPPTLKAHSWQYILENQHAPVPAIKSFKTSIDLWDWNQYALKPLDTIFTSCIKACDQHGYCALTFHPILFEHPSQKRLIEILVTALKTAGFESYDLLQEINR